MNCSTEQSTDANIPSPVRDFYTGRSVFITGATGFMGKVLVEKLLRSCPGIKAIYILIRANTKSDVKSRMEDFISSKLFDIIRSECPESLKKIIPIEGDVSLPNLGMSNENEKILIENVSVVIHSAACVHYYGRLKKIINTNTVGTLRMMELCEKIKHMESFVYISTIAMYFGSTQNEETVIPTSVDPWNVFKCIEWMNDDMLEAISPQLVHNHFFPYTFSKALAEKIVVEKSGKFPTAIYRPGLVIPTYEDPFPGWVDNGNGFGDLFLAMQKGLLHSIYIPFESRTPLIPCDSAIKTIICIAWNTAMARSNTLKVYNCTSTTEKNVNVREFLGLATSEMYNYPIPNMIWYPFLIAPNSEFENNILNFFYLYLPALFADTFRFVIGKKRNAEEEPQIKGSKRSHTFFEYILGLFQKTISD